MKNCIDDKKNVTTKSTTLQRTEKSRCYDLLKIEGSSVIHPNEHWSRNQRHPNKISLLVSCMPANDLCLSLLLTCTEQRLNGVLKPSQLCRVANQKDFSRLGLRFFVPARQDGQINSCYYLKNDSLIQHAIRSFILIVFRLRFVSG